MDMNVRGAVLNGVVHPHVTFEPLVQVASLRYVDRNPIPILVLFRVNVIAGQSLEGAVYGINLILIFLPGVAEPIEQD